MWCRKCKVSFSMTRQRRVGGLIFKVGYCPECNNKIIYVEKEPENVKEKFLQEL